MIGQEEWHSFNLGTGKVPKEHFISQVKVTIFL
jgi:hypothetical protein